MGRTRAAWAAFAVTTAMLVGVASAAATPGSLEFGRCVAKTPSKFRNNNCTKKAKTEAEGKFEWEPLTSGIKSVAKKERETHAVEFESAGGSKFLCTAMNQTAGEFGPGSDEESNVQWLAAGGCEALGGKCESAGRGEGEIAFNTLRGVLGIVKAEAKEEKDIVGIVFAPQSGPYLAEFSCLGAPVKVRGTLIIKMQADSTGGTTGELTNKMLSKFELEFVSEPGGKQVPEEFEGGPKQTPEASLSGGAFEQESLSMTLVQETSPKTTKVELRKCEVNVC